MAVALLSFDRRTLPGAGIALRVSAVIVGSSPFGRVASGITMSPMIR
jgi:hypothetical protein